MLTLKNNEFDNEEGSSEFRLIKNSTFKTG